MFSFELVLPVLECDRFCSHRQILLFFSDLYTVPSCGSWVWRRSSGSGRSRTQSRFWPVRGWLQHCLHHQALPDQVSHCGCTGTSSPSSLLHMLPQSVAVCLLGVGFLLICQMSVWPTGWDQCSSGKHGGGWLEVAFLWHSEGIRLARRPGCHSLHDWASACCCSGGENSCPSVVVTVATGAKVLRFCTWQMAASRASTS